MKDPPIKFEEVANLSRHANNSFAQGEMESLLFAQPSDTINFLTRAELDQCCFLSFC